MCLTETFEDAIGAADELTPEDVREGFKTVRSRGKTLFKSIYRKLQMSLWVMR